MNTTSETWKGSGSYQLSLRSRVALHVDEVAEGFAWGITEAWSQPQPKPKRKLFGIVGLSPTQDEAKAAAEQMAARILKVRRPYR